MVKKPSDHSFGNNNNFVYMAKPANTASAGLPAGWGTAEEVQSNWFKFETVGDHIKGTLLKKSFQKSNRPGFADQWVYELKTEDGSVVNVGVPTSKDGTVKRLNNVTLGTIVGILFEKEGEPSTKGFAPSKWLKILSFGKDPNYSEMEGGEEVQPEIEF